MPRNPAGKVLKNLLRGGEIVVRGRRRPGAVADDRRVLFDFHRVWGYVAIVANFLAGLYTLAAWRWKRLRGTLVWIADDRRPRPR